MMEVLEIKRDNKGRMMYNAELHTRQGKPWTMDELVYLAKYYEKDGPETLGLALERTPQSCNQKMVDIKRSGKYESYKKMDEYYV